MLTFFNKYHVILIDDMLFI